jgi:hypothetical protein
MSKHSDKTSKQNLRMFLAGELSSLSDMEMDALIAEIGRTRAKFSKYEKGSNAAKRRFSYLSQKTACRNIRQHIQGLTRSLGQADLMVTDDLSDYLGDPDFKTNITGKLIEIQKACDLILGVYPYTGQGRQLDRVLYAWVIDMVKIYESAFKPKRADHHKNGKFMYFLKCWKPDEIPLHGDRLSPRTVKRVIAHMADTGQTLIFD